jgi:putative membrane protein
MRLTGSDHERIECAVAAAEGRTRAEIVCAVVEEASVYETVPLAWAAAGALVLPVLALAFARVETHYGMLGHIWVPHQLATTHASLLSSFIIYALVQCLLLVVILFGVALPPVRRRLTPAALKRAKVRERAEEEFRARRLDRTHDHTGVLIFVALAERRIEVIADRGAAAEIDPAAWERLVSDLGHGLHDGQVADALELAVWRCGDLLSEHLPAGPDNPNELPDGVLEPDRR